MDMSDAKLTVMAYSANPKIRENLFFQHSGERASFTELGSTIRRALDAVVRFWDRGGDSVDALYDTRTGMSHFMESDGASVQYYGDRSAFKPASTASVTTVETQEKDPGLVLDSEERFGQAPAPVRKSQSKAS